MPETYNPRERTFIKVPEAKFCPQCGQQLPSDVKPMSNVMNNYISTTGNRMTINSDAPTVVINGVTLYKASKIKEGDKAGQWNSEFIPKNAVLPVDKEKVVEVPKSPILASNLGASNQSPVAAST